MMGKRVPLDDYSLEQCVCLHTPEIGALGQISRIFRVSVPSTSSLFLFSGIYLC